MPVKIPYEDDAAAGRALAQTYAPVAARLGMSALFALDARLGSILRGTHEPIVGQMRLTWWYEALVRLDTGAPPAEPVLAAVAQDVMPHGVRGASLADMVEGWEVLLGDEPLGDAALATYASGRGARLFGALGQVTGAAASDPLEAAGEAWALYDLAAHVRDRDIAARADRLARERSIAIGGRRWSRNGRAIGALLLVAARPGAGPGIVPRLLWHRLTGR